MSTTRTMSYAQQRARERITDLAARGLDVVTFWASASEVVASTVPHFLSPCWFTLDPASLLVTSHYQADMPQIPHEWLAHEYYEDDVHKIADVARAPRGYSTLHEATQGDPGRSAAWRQFIQPFGADQELFIALRTRAGVAWGVMGLYREPDQPPFGEDEINFLQEISSALAEGARRGLLVGEAAEQAGPEAPGLLVLNDDWRIESMTPGVESWLDELPDSTWRATGALPPVVLAVAGRALRPAHSPDQPGEIAMARVLSRAGRWMVLHGAPLVADRSRRVAVIIEPAHPARISSLLMAAYGLTEREQDVTRLVLQGRSTTDIARHLCVSAATVQQHLKSIFEKTGVRSRRELVGNVFFSHYEPRVRDNEQRARLGRPIVGEPLGWQRDNHESNSGE
jgi:DNA-binding CsgD family transcriptional regulator